MTTTVEIKANHGWPVDIHYIDPKTGEIQTTTRLPAGTHKIDYVHSGRDMYIHEVQPDEIEAETGEE